MNREMASGKKITREAQLKALDNKGMFYCSVTKFFSCRYCNSYINSDKVWMANRHLATTQHDRNVDSRNKEK